MSKSNPDQRFTVRIKQRSGGWAICRYAPTFRKALEQTAEPPIHDYIWAVFDKHTKALDCRGWSGDIDFQCQIWARDHA
jgi:hypothetical protein